VTTNTGFGDCWSTFASTPTGGTGVTSSCTGAAVVETGAVLASKVVGCLTATGVVGASGKGNSVVETGATVLASTLVINVVVAVVVVTTGGGAAVDKIGGVCCRPNFKTPALCF
jgi:hypothetical protein